MNMPEKLWITYEDSLWSSRSFRASDLDHGPEYPCYVRIDLFEQQAKQIEDLLKICKQLQTEIYNVTISRERELGWTGY